MVGAVSVLSNVMYSCGRYAADASSSNVSSNLNPHGAFGSASPASGWMSLPGYTSVTGYAMVTPELGRGPQPTTAVSGGGTYAGEWLQIELPEPVVPTAYVLTPATGTLDGQPMRFALVASDTSNAGPWTLLDATYAGTDVPVRDVPMSITLSASFAGSGTSFRFFRVIVIRVATSASPAPIVPAAVARMQLTGLPITSLVSMNRSAVFVSGRLGLGSAAPTQRLDVRGSVYVSSNVGIGVDAPTASLQLSRDSAMKPSTSTWTISSDKRLKSDIVDADLTRCYDIVRSVPLRRFAWAAPLPPDVAPDRHRLGWIAQEVELAFPKAVDRVSMYGLDDCRTLNTDQLMAALYGCVQMLQQQVEALAKSLSLQKS
jgi:hypothetical protein